MINTIIFDLDGTLLDTLEDLKDSTNFALLKHGYPIRTIDEVRKFVGNGIEKLIERAIPEGLQNPKHTESVELFKENYAKNMFNKTKPYCGITELLILLNENNYNIAVVSNKFDAAVKELCEKYFGGLIQVAIGKLDNVRKKPAPDAVLKAMDLLGTRKNETVYVGDSDVDVQTAKNAGLPFIGVSWGFRSRELLAAEGAGCIIDSPTELLATIKRIPNS